MDTLKDSKLKRLKINRRPEGESASGGRRVQTGNPENTSDTGSAGTAGGAGSTENRQDSPNTEPTHTHTHTAGLYGERVNYTVLRYPD